MFCEKCGKELPADAMFCHFCGTAVTPEQPQNTYSARASGYGAPQPQYGAPQQQGYYQNTQQNYSMQAQRNSVQFRIRKNLSIIILAGILSIVIVGFGTPKFFKILESPYEYADSPSEWETYHKSNNYSNSKEADYTNKNELSESDISKVEINVTSAERTYGTNYININYQIKNNMSTDISFMNFRFTLLDENGNPITSKDWSAYSNIPSGELQQGTSYIEYDGNASSINTKITYLKDSNGRTYGGSMW